MTELPPFDPDDLDADSPFEQAELEHRQRAEANGAGDAAAIAGDDEAPELAQAPTPAAPAPQFSYNDRLYALALTRSGKSELLNVIFSGLACQRLLLDPKPEFSIPGHEPVSTPDEIDWTAPLIHYKPAPGSDCAQYEQIFAQAFTRRGLTICAHELAALVDYQPNRAGRYMISYCAQGGALGLGLLAGTTRPKLVPTAAIAEATHVICLPPQLARREDTQAAAEALSPVGDLPLTGDDLAGELAHLPRYGFLWKDRRQEGAPLHSFPPLPEAVRRLSIVQRTEDA